MKNNKIYKPKEIPTCRTCQRKMKPAYDRVAKKITGHLWHCSCYPNNFLSIG